MKVTRNILTTKFFVIVMVLVFFLNFLIPTILKKSDDLNEMNNANAGMDTEETVYEIDKHAEWNDTMLNITMWDEDITSASSIAQVASLAKDYGYTGVDYAINWYNIQNALTGENMYDFSRIDSRLEAIYKKGMLSCVSVFFTTSYYDKHLSQEMMDALKWQETADGQVFFKENYGAAPCISDPYTHSVLVNAFEAFCTHIFEKYGTSVTRVEARISQYGELEYYSGASSALDYSAPAMKAFIEYLQTQYQTVSNLCTKYGNSKYSSYSWDLLLNALNDKTTNQQVTAAFDFDWQEFRQKEVMRLSKGFQEATHRACETANVTDKNGNRVNIPFAFQVGSVYDGASYSLRGTYDPYLMSKNADIVHTDDAPLYDHSFSADFMMVNKNGLYASELDGYWHILMKGESVRNGYRDQASTMGASGVQYLNTANWSFQSMFQERNLLKDYSELFFNTPKREYVGDVNPAHAKTAILINTADLIYKKQSAEASYMLGDFYNLVTENGKYKMQFLTDTQLLENPQLLDEYTTLYLGGLFNNEYYMRTALVDLLKSKQTTLKPYTNATTFTLKNEYGIVISKNGLVVL